jgi:hypothetical protein
MSSRSRGGRFPHPFGLYSEILRVGTLRPLYSLPTSVYKDSGFTATAVTGFTFLGDIDLGSNWLMHYDLYGGQGRVIEGMASLEGEPPEDIDELFGARLQFETPVDGLMFGVAGYWGRHDGIEVEAFDMVFPLGVDPVDHGVAGVQLQYLNGPWEARTEYYHQWEDVNHNTEVFYVEGAYRINKWIQLATRFDYLDTDLQLFIPPALGTLAPEILNHYEVTVGANFWVGRNFVFKVNYSHVWDNRFARPEGSEVTGEFIDETDLVTLGVQFSF